MKDLKPCPFCGGTAQKIRSSGDERDGYADRVSYVCSGCGCCRGAVGDSGKGGYADNSQVETLALAAWNTRAAPAEDVRAVGEEPVAILKRGPLIPLSARFLAESLDLPIGEHALYRHPQRPVVLPEREMYSRYFRGIIPENRLEVEAYKDGWNACLDAVEGLKK